MKTKVQILVIVLMLLVDSLVNVDNNKMTILKKPKDNVGNCGSRQFKNSLNSYQAWVKTYCQNILLLSKKKKNQRKHSQEGNRNKILKMGWWNDKCSAKELFRNNRDKLGEIISRKGLSILGI